MNDISWRGAGRSGAERWDLVETKPYPAPMRGMYRHIIGSVMKVKNKHCCRDWVVHYAEKLGTRGTRIYLGRLDDMTRDEAKDAARLLILAQRVAHHDL